VNSNASPPPQTASQRVEAAGITAHELLERTRREGIRTTPVDEFSRWLIDANLAELDGELLRPTARAIELGGAIYR
jgi:hypothetical protein